MGGCFFTFVGGNASAEGEGGALSAANGGAVSAADGGAVSAGESGAVVSANVASAFGADCSITMLLVASPAGRRSGTPTLSELLCPGLAGAS